MGGPDQTGLFGGGPHETGRRRGLFVGARAFAQATTKSSGRPVLPRPAPTRANALNEKRARAHTHTHTQTDIKHAKGERADPGRARARTHAGERDTRTHARTRARTHTHERTNARQRACTNTITHQPTLPSPPTYPLTRARAWRLTAAHACMRWRRVRRSC